MSTSPIDVTLDATPMPTGSGGSKPKVHMAAGSGPQLDCETRDIRRKRLQISSLVLCLAFGAFFIWRIVADFILNMPKFTLNDSMSMWLWISHGAIIALLAVSALNLCRKCALSVFSLLTMEFVVFGSPVVFLVMMQFATLPGAVERHSMMPAITPPWLLLTYVYALFIPNCWRRSLPAIGTFCAVPILVVGVLALTHAECGSFLAESPTIAVEVTLIMLIAATSSLIGVHTINNLRREAFRAKQLGQYRLKHRLGAGGMGEVYLAEHQMMKRPCAIKLIRPEKAGDPNALARFEREVKATATLSHWNSIEIYDYGRTDDGAFYYVMEYLPGLSLAEIVAKHGPMPPERAIHFLHQTCEALQEAHELGLIHRDIKPANIFSAQRGGIFDVTKLLDFGLAKPARMPTGDTSLTQEGSITGSPLFMAPEQVEGEGPIDHRADLYALGIVGYYLITGRTPFAGDKTIQVLVSQLRDTPPAPSSFVAEIPQDLEAVIMRCLEKRPADRFQSAAEMAQALESCEHAGQWNDDQAKRWWNENSAEEVVPQEPALV